MTCWDQIPRSGAAAKDGDREPLPIEDGTELCAVLELVRLSSTDSHNRSSCAWSVSVVHVATPKAVPDLRGRVIGTPLRNGGATIRE